MASVGVGIAVGVLVAGVLVLGLNVGSGFGCDVLVDVGTAASVRVGSLAGAQVTSRKADNNTVIIIFMISRPFQSSRSAGQV